MAYGVKYFSQYRAGNTVRRIELQLDGYAGPATEWFCSVSAPRDSQGDSDSFFGEVVVSKVFEMEFLFDQHYDLREFVAEPRTYKCVVTEGADIKFQGFVEPYNTSRDYQAPNYFVRMTATCGLNRLAKNKFVQTEFNEANIQLNYFEILQKCLNTIGIERTLRVSLHVYMNSSPSAPNPMLSVELSVFRHFKDGIWTDAQTTVMDILQRFNAQLYVENDMWVVRSSVDHVNGFTGYIEYPVGGGQTIVPEWPGLIRDVNYSNPGDDLGDAASVDGGNVGLQPRIRKYTVDVDLGGNKDAFQNSGLQLWTVDGPVGWEGTMMPALGGFGWTKVETGVEGSPYAMSIRGKAPQPYFKTHKKGIWPFRKTVKTPIEPSIYWETTKIPVIPGVDDGIHVGFEYYTEADSAGFLYAIVMQSRDLDTGEIRTTYVKPESKGATLSNDFQLLTAPPHPKVNPTNGITQAKGRIEYDIDMTEIVTHKKKYETWFRVWLYFSVDEPGKTGDEYWIYTLFGERTTPIEEQVPEGDSKFKMIAESNPYESDEGGLIQLMSGDYSMGFLGTTVKMGGIDWVPSGGWTRRGRNESISIYRAMLLDRMAMTYFVPDVVETDIKLFDGEDITYSTLLRFLDRSPTRLYKIVRLDTNHYTRIVSVVAIEATYTDITEYKIKSYTDARGLLDETTEGDAVYPGGGTPTGRVNVEDLEDVFDQDEEPTAEQIANGRMGVFEDVPALIYTVNERSTAAVHLRDFLSTAYLESEQDDEELDAEELHDPEDFVLSVVAMPSWVESIEIDKLSVYVTAKPTAVGEFQLTLSVVDDAFGTIPNVIVPIVVYPPFKLKYTLRDTSGPEPVVIGEIFNGAGFNKPETSFDIQVEISGHHEGWYGRLTTPDDVILATIDPYSLVSSRETGTYLIGEDVPAEIGFYQIDLGVFRNEGEEDNLRRRKTDRIKFSFYDEETLAKAQFFLWGAESNTLIGPIKPDGSSSFVVKEAWDIKMLIADVLHDAGTSVLGSEVGDLDTKEIIIPNAVEDAEYFQFGEVRDEFDPSTYNVLLRLTLADPVTGEPEDQYVRAISFQINHKTVQPTAGVLKLGTIPQNTTDFDVIGELAATGGSYPLPEERWSVMNNSESAAFDSDEWFLYRFVGGQLVNIDISAYTGNPQVNSYGEPITQVQSLLFGWLGSKDIGNPSIHKMPSTFRVINRRRLAGAIVAVYQADFSFGPPVPIDDAPVGGPSTGTGGVVLEAGNGIFIAKDDEYNTINVLANPNEFTFDSDPLARTMNLKPGAVTLTHMANLPSMSVIGNMTGGADTPAAVSVITSTALAGATNSVLATALAIKTYVDDKFTSIVSGTVNYFAKFITATALGVGLLSESGISVIANNGHFVSSLAPNANVRGLVLSTATSLSRWQLGKYGLETGSESGSDFGIWRFNDAGGFLGAAVTISRATGLTTLPGTLTIQGTGVVISTTSITLNPNFNADLLDGNHGVWYQDRVNHTGTQLAATISDFAAAVRAVPLTGLSITSGAILATDTILQAFGKIQGQLNTVGGHVGAGTVNYFAYYNTATTLAAGIMFQTATSVNVNGFLVADVPTNSNVRGLSLQTGAVTRWNLGKAGLETGSGDAGADFTLWSYTDAGVFKAEIFRVSRATSLMQINGTLTISTSGIVIQTTSTTMNPNLNADLLDGYHASQLMDRANHTGFQAISTVTGLQAALDAKTTGSGTAGRIVKYIGSLSMGDSVMSEASGNITLNGGVFVIDVAHNPNARGVSFTASGLSRWTIGKAGTESGSDSGSDLVAWSYNDAGAFLREAFRIARASGNMTLAGSISVSGGNSGQWNTAYSWGNHAGLYALLSHTHTIANVTGLQAALDAKNSGSGTTGRIPKYTGSLTFGDSIMYESSGNMFVEGQLFSNTATNSNVRGFNFQNGGVARWSVGKAGIESGSNSGSDYVAWSYDDAGAFLREAFRISRANGNMTLAGSISVSGGNSGQWNTAYSWGNHAGLYAAASHTHTISQVTSLQSALDGKVGNWGNGVDNRFALWVNSGQSIGNSNLYYNAGNIGVGKSPGYPLDVAGAIRTDNQIASTLASGTKPIDVLSTTMCTNLNADMVDGLHASAFAAASHTHTASQITDFTSAARGTISGSGSISYNSSTGVISYTGSAGLSGSGSSSYFAMWTGGSSLGISTIRDTGSEINFANSRSLGVEGPAAMRDYLHVWGYQANGTASNHGTLILHNLASASINSCAAIEILSTTRGFLNARMSRAQRLAISSPQSGLVVYQTDTVGASLTGLKLYSGGVWYHMVDNAGSA